MMPRMSTKIMASINVKPSENCCLGSVKMFIKCLETPCLQMKVTPKQFVCKDAIYMPSCLDKKYFYFVLENPVLLPL